MREPPGTSLKLRDLDQQIEAVENRIVLRQHRIAGRTRQLKNQVREKLSSPLVLISGALIGIAVIRRMRMLPAGRSSLLRTVDLLLLIVSRVALLKKLKILPVRKKPQPQVPYYSPAYPRPLYPQPPYQNPPGQWRQ
ncbi:MAG TPA: hypothetical protein VKZ92_04840 [Pseudohongiella sp.]|nr:hypothetical protein [Pseudohongiella sp.]